MATPSMRRPIAYTGPNRCRRCTVLNLALLGVGVATIMIAAGLRPAAMLAAVGTGMIWWRGYLVPGTPWLMQMLPRSLRRRLGRHQATPMDYLQAHGIVETSRDALTLDATFVRSVNDAIVSTDRDTPRATARAALEVALAERLPLDEPGIDHEGIIAVLSLWFERCPTCAEALVPASACCGGDTPWHCPNCVGMD